MWLNPEKDLSSMSDKELAANGKMLAALEASLSTKGELKEFRLSAEDPLRQLV